MASDRDWLLGVLSDGLEHSLAEILSRSMNERGCGLTTHSRISDLRSLGHVIEHRQVRGAARGHAHVYQLVSLAKPDPAIGAGGSGSASETAPFAQSGPVTDDGRPFTLRGSSVAGWDDRIHGDERAGPDCGDGQLSLVAASATRGAYGEAA